MQNLSEKHKLEGYVKLGLSNSEIARLLGRSDRTIRYWANKLKNGTLFNEPVRPGRPPKSTARDLRHLRREVQKNGIRRIQDIARDAGLEVSEATARKMAKKCGVFYASRPKVPFINEANKKNRKVWARAHQNKDSSYWDRVVWTDETTICLTGGYGPRKSWVTKDSKYRGKNPLTFKKFGGVKVMFWGCFTSDGAGLFIPIVGTLNAVRYVELLREHVLPWIRQRERDLGVSLVFQQDNAPPHTAAITREFLAQNGVEVLDWPPCSPDLNPIENMWAILKRRLSETFIGLSTAADLKRSAAAMWSRFSREECLRLVQNMPRRIKAVLDAKGGPTSY